MRQFQFEAEAAAFVYLWTDNKEKKFYIGVHRGTPEDGYVCSSKYVLKEYRERPQDFTREVLHTGTWREMLCKEQDLIIECNAVKSAQYYNKAHSFGPYHGDRTGSKQSSETRAKIGAASAARGSEISAHNKRRITSPETRARISAAQMGRVLSPATRAKIGAAHMGKLVSPETRAKLAASHMGKRPSPETRAKLAAAQKGRKHSSEACAKMRAAMTPERRSELSAARIGKKRGPYMKRNPKIAAAEQI